MIIYKHCPSVLTAAINILSFFRSSDQLYPAQRTQHGKAFNSQIFTRVSCYTRQCTAVPSAQTYAGVCHFRGSAQQICLLRSRLLFLFCLQLCRQLHPGIVCSAVRILDCAASSITHMPQSQNDNRFCNCPKIHFIKEGLQWKSFLS